MSEDYLGDDMILGDDLDSLMGDDVILGEDDYLGGPRGAVARVVRKKPGMWQQQFLGFPATAVTAAASANISATPQRTFRTERFVVSSAIAAFFTLNDLRIGRESMNVTTDGIPAAVFSEVGVGVSLRGYTANLGNTIVANVTNNDGATQTFRGGILGTALV